MAVTAANGGTVVLGTAQTGNADTTNTVDRGARRGTASIVLTNTTGSTPTVKVDIMGSVDGTNFSNAAYCLVATPTTVAVAQITVTTAVTTTYIIPSGQPWQFYKLTYSANTNETLTATWYG